MGRQKNADRQDVKALEQRAPKKTYSKPALRRLGTISELTQMGTKYTK